MPKKDLKHNIDVKQAIASTHVTGNGTTTGNIIDRKGFESLTFLIVGDTLTDGVYTPTVTVGNDSALTDGVAAAADYILDSLADSALAATEDNKVRTLGYNGPYRYARMDLVASAVTTGGYVSAQAVLGHPLDAPTTTLG